MTTHRPFLRARGLWRTPLRRRRMRRIVGQNALRLFADAYPNAFFIEIGANDGELADPLHPFVTSCPWSGIMVEPIPHVFERLRSNVAALDRVAVENAAIADQEGSLRFYYLEEVDDPEREGLPEWYRAIGSLSRDALLRHVDLIPDIESRITSSEVPCLSFDSLCRRHGVDAVDLLLVDTEGHDYEILKQVDFGKYRPRLIIYEHLHLSRSDRAECRARLEGLGYSTIEELFDTWCLDTRPRDRLTRKWRSLRPAYPGVSHAERVAMRNPPSARD